MKSILYGVGVGPGDPELMTLKALKVIEDCDVIVLPSTSKYFCTAYQIAQKVLPGLDQKLFLGLDMPMTKDAELLEQAHSKGAERVRELLETGYKPAFLTLGDPTVYSTYMYIHKKIVEWGYQAEIINGVPSFCAAAAKLGISLGEGGDAIHIIPASYEVEEALELTGTKVLMKSGRRLEEIKELLADTEAYAVQNCGMESEQVFYNLEELPTEDSYYTTIIIRQGEIDPVI